MYSAQTEGLVDDIDQAMGYLFASGQTGAVQYGELARARSGLMSEPEGTPGYDSYAGLAEAQVNQVNDMRRDAFEGDPAADPEFGAAACDCEPGEPCCLRAFEVEDAEAGSRKVIWPVPPDGPERLYMATKDPTNGQPSAKVKVTLTDKERCKLNFAKPLARPVGHADGPDYVLQSEEITVTSPFQLPAFNTGMLPREMMLVIYLVGMVLQARSYRNHEPVAINPDQCMTPGATGVEVFAVPHAAFNAAISGELKVMLSLTQLPTLAAGLTGSVTGSVGHQSISWTASAEATSAPRQSEPQGPIDHPMFDFFDKIQSAMDVIANHDTRRPVTRQVLAAPQPFALTLALRVDLNVANLAVQGKAGSPNLEVAYGACSIAINPSVTGTVDVWQLMLTRIPRGRQVAAALADPGNALRASASCEISVGGSGTAMMEVLGAGTIEVGSGDDLERSFGNIDTRFTGLLDLTAGISASARLDLETWLITASASASGSVTTGWSFGGRVQNNADGTQKWERRYAFQGITLRVQGQVDLGATEETTDTDVFGDAEDSPTETTIQTSDAFGAQNTVASGGAEYVLFAADENESEWYEV